jgi:hypothetical protein
MTFPLASASGGATRTSFFFSGGHGITSILIPALGMAAADRMGIARTYAVAVYFYALLFGDGDLQTKTAAALEDVHHADGVPMAKGSCAGVPAAA